MREDTGMVRVVQEIKPGIKIKYNINHNEMEVYYGFND